MNGNITDQTVLVVGGGPAGLSAALELAQSGIRVWLLEKSETLGGHAARLTCKAAPECVRCGACMVESRIQQVQSNPLIEPMIGSTIQTVSRTDRYQIDVSQNGQRMTREVDAVILATGFKPFDPSQKPYGYGRFPNVLTNLDLEDMLRQTGKVIRPSDKRIPETMAFIQCVGSRDITLNHLWCSRICCASALRMARRIQHIQAGIEVTFFYIDVQTFGKNFEQVYPDIKSRIRQIRAIPGDIAKTADDRLRIGFFDPTERIYREDIFDLAVLSVGMTPSVDHGSLKKMFPISLNRFGFISEQQNQGNGPGIFTAGSALQPMGIAESIASGSRAAAQVMDWLSVEFCRLTSDS
ncbi:MAG: FAD-dependent oxidoreductase [Desulfatirhabdiaceae bacterium]